MDDLIISASTSETCIVLRKNETNKNVFNTPSVKEHAAFKGEL
jgi:hypothetical protein